MPVLRTSTCPICAKPTETAAIASVQVAHGKCWVLDLQRRRDLAPPDSHIRRAIEETLAAIAKEQASERA